MKVFCEDCRTMRAVMDTYEDDDGDLYRERGGLTSRRLAMPLECGHSAPDGSSRPAVNPRFRPDPLLVERVVELQRRAH